MHTRLLAFVISSLALLFVVTCPGYALSYEQAILADNPIGYWRFDETSTSQPMHDSAIDPLTQGGVQNGRYLGSPTLGQPGALVSDPASTSMYINGNDWADVVFPITASFSVDMWVKSATNTWNANGWAASERDQDGLLMHPNDNNTIFGVYVSDNLGDHHIVHQIVPDDITQWNHYAMTYDAATDTGSAFLNGQHLFTKIDVLGSRSRSSSRNIRLEIGWDNCCSGPRHGHGWIDELAIYNHVLTPEQIERHYQVATDTYEPPLVIPVPLTALAALPIFGAMFARRTTRA